MIEHATLAPVDVYTTPAPVIELMPAPVIEYIAPSPAVSYPSFLVNPQFSIHADETSQMPVVVQEIPEVQVVERIQEQSVEPVEAPLQEQIGDIPVPPIVEEIVDLVPVLPHEHPIYL